MPRRILIGFGVDIDAVAGWYVLPRFGMLLVTPFYLPLGWGPMVERTL